MKKYIIIVTLCLCCLVSMAIAEKSPSISISVDNSSISVKNGNTITVNVHVDAPEGENTSISGFYDNGYICTATLGEHTGSDTELIITGTGMGVGMVTVYMEEYPEITAEITVDVAMSSEEQKMIDKVKYLSDCSFIYYDEEDCYYLLFSLKDANETRIAAPSKVEMRIENDKGVIVYNKTHYLTPHDFFTWTSKSYGERYLASVQIDPADILESESSSGTVYFTITNGNYYFSESAVSTSKLPKVNLVNICSLTIPTVPVELSYSYSISDPPNSKVYISDLTYNFTENHNGTVDLTLYFNGEKTYDRKGSDNNATCVFMMKLFDAEGYVIETNTIYIERLHTGEKFKNYKEKIYNLEPGTYSLKLTDYYLR